MDNHYTPDTDNHILDVFVYSTDINSPVMLKTFDAATGCYLNLNSGITIGDLIRKATFKKLCEEKG